MSSLTKEQERLERLSRMCLDRHMDFKNDPGPQRKREMGDEEQATLDGQFFEFSKMMDKKRDGTTITLYFSDFWLRQAKLLDDKKVTMTETGILFNKFSKTEITWDEWLEFLSDLCELKGLNEENVHETLTNCGLPGQTPVQSQTLRFLVSGLYSRIRPPYRLSVLRQIRSSHYHYIMLILRDTLYCNATHDGFLCWPPTPAGTLLAQHCPSMRLSDPSRFAERRCGDMGMWLGRRLADSDEYELKGWTNFSDCFPNIVQTLLTKVFGKMDESTVAAKFEIAETTRTLEIIGFSVSLASLLLSLFIFSYYRKLRNNRTRIHKSLFIAMIVQVFVRLIIYTDQAVVREKQEYYDYIGKNVSIHGIDNMPFVCESFYVMLEYTTTVMFMWMFIEGLHLHNIVSTNPLNDIIPHLVYFAIGWGVPLIITSIWVGLTAWSFDDKANRCWYGYNFSLQYWVMQAPRLAVIICNFVFLLKIMKVVIVKLRLSESCEIKRVRKAVRAALLLLPLLGITNVLNMINGPLEGNVWQFAAWSYTTHFLRSFQGFFIALIYCFLNGEVRQVIVKHYNDYMAMHPNLRCIRDSFINWFRSEDGTSKRRERESRRWLELKPTNLLEERATINPIAETAFVNNSQESQNIVVESLPEHLISDLEAKDVDCEAIESILQMPTSEEPSKEETEVQTVQVEVTIHREN